MKNIVLFDTSVGTTNKGDNIIMLSAEQGLEPILNTGFVTKFPTHTTPFSLYQTYFWWKAKYVYDADLKFICGTNLLANNLRYDVNDLNIHLWNSRPLRNSVLVGVGNSKLDKKINSYTRKLYSNILSHEYIHGTRDDETTEMLQSLGYKAITIGCPTLWGLTPEHCAHIPTKKAEKVVFTLTGVQSDIEKDQYLIDLLQRNYSEVYLWLQTIWDYDYFATLKNTQKIKILMMDVEPFGRFLDKNEIDYVGTRLHGGVFAMQHKKRSIIISIDNRARNINKVNHLNCIERDDIVGLEDMVNSSVVTDIRMNYDNLNKWMHQFE